MNKSRGSPRKFSEKIALLNKKEAEATAEFEKIIKEVEETTRAPLPQVVTNASPQCSSSWSDSGYFIEGQAALETVFNHYVPQDQSPHLQHQQHNQIHHHLSPNSQIGGSGSGSGSGGDGDGMHQLPVGLVPNIEIFPINDDQPEQQVPYMESTNHISSARSLPDIANLRVSNSTFNQINPSYSDQRITNPEYDYEYDANSNIVSDSNCAPQTYCSTHASNQEVTNLQDINNSWQQTTTAPTRLTYHQPIQNSHSQVIQHHDFYPQSQPELIVRANSTNAVSNSWPNTDNTLSPTRLNCNLSKSSEVYFGYPEHDQTTANNRLEADFTNHPQQQQQVTNHRVRSSSYNNVENFDSQNGIRIQRSYTQQQSQQQMFMGTQQYQQH